MATPDPHTPHPHPTRRPGLTPWGEPARSQHRPGGRLPTWGALIGGLLVAPAFGADAGPERFADNWAAIHDHSQRCMQLQLQREFAGRKLGDPVSFTADGRRLSGRVLAFRCESGLTGQDAALVERTDDPRQPWTYVLKLADLAAR